MPRKPKKKAGLDYEAIMAKARFTNALRDEEDREVGYAPPGPEHGVAQWIKCAMSAIECGIGVGDWNAVAEGQAMLEEIVKAMKEGT